MIPKNFAVITSGGGWETKLLDEKRVGDICGCVSQYGLKPVLSWYGVHEKQRATRISESSGISIEQLGNLPVDVFMEILRMARLVIGPDTGTVHAASAVETPTVSYYGPTSAMYSGPRRPTDKVIQLSPRCGPCFKRQCEEKLCRHLRIQEILGTIDHQLEGKKLPA